MTGLSSEHCPPARRSAGAKSRSSKLVEHAIHEMRCGRPRVPVFELYRPPLEGSHLVRPSPRDADDLVARPHVVNPHAPDAPGGYQALQAEKPPVLMPGRQLVAT